MGSIYGTLMRPRPVGCGMMGGVMAYEYGVVTGGGIQT